mmetsp:Transcript_15646/g.39713  ORF Transcript_15646/g.39713 Transcript_15646/m.39713 type:complete len:92 (-) Transcript_15646:1378-1653(-)
MCKKRKGARCRSAADSKLAGGSGGKFARGKQAKTQGFKHLKLPFPRSCCLPFKIQLPLLLLLLTTSLNALLQGCHFLGVLVAQLLQLVVRF